MKPLVTIIIPCHNYAQYLGEAIGSALEQTYRPIEIIVVDDGSTDNTIEVASKYPVTLYTQENQGASNTFNKGIELAKGEYLVILSADDKLCPTFIEKTLHILERDSDIAFVYTHAYLFGAVTGNLLSREYNVEHLKMSNYITGTALTRKKAFQIAGKFNPSFLCLEDWDLWLSFAEKGLYGKLIPEPLFYYRQQALSRNVFSPRVYRETVLKIWKNHRGLYSLRDIFKMVALGRLHAISSCAIRLLRITSPIKFRKRISDIERKMRYPNGCIIIKGDD